MPPRSVRSLPLRLLWFLGCLCAPLMAETHYETLGVAKDASVATIKKAYYKLAKSLHPDKVADGTKAERERRFKQVASAYSVLSDDAKRREYNQELLTPAQQQQQQQPQRRTTSSSQTQTFTRGVSSLRDLQQATGGAKRKLAQHLLLALHDSRDSACQNRMKAVNFPAPFAGMSQGWHGVDWGTILTAVSHDVGPSLRAGRPSDVLSAFEGVVGRAVRAAHGVAMPRCPTFIFQRSGSALGEGNPETASIFTEDAFVKWVFGFLEHKLIMRNEYGAKVRINWIHGDYVKEMLVLSPRAWAERTVYLSHTLHAERIDRKGQTISDNSSLLIFKVTNSSEMVVPYVTCLDLSADCEDWQRKGECSRNPGYMKTECPRSCDLCPRAAPPTKAKATPRARAKATARGAPTVSTDGELCGDDHGDCVTWAIQGQCDTNPKYMRDNCKRSCGLCGSCFDNATECRQWKEAGECESNAAYMRISCSYSCGLCDEGSTSAADQCVDETSDCLVWAAGGECDSNAEFMNLKCRRACGQCGAEECADAKGKPCKKWAEAGECINNARFMSQHCRSSCGMCGNASDAVVPTALCKDKHKRDGECARWREVGHCESNQKWMHDNCKRSCGLCDCADLSPKEKCDEWLKAEQCTRNRRFMAKHCLKSCGWCGEAEESAGKDACYDEDIKCEEWAKGNECRSNAAFMNVECMKSCSKCSSARKSSRLSAPPAAPAKPVHAKPPPIRTQPAAKSQAETAKPAAANSRAASRAASQPGPAAAQPPVKEGCVDHDHRCGAWAKNGQCVQSFMRRTCPLSCDPDCMPAKEPEPPCEDKLPKDCPILARSQDACDTDFMKESCIKSCGRCASQHGRATKDEL